MRKRVVVIGGGISGLTAAYFLHANAPATIDCKLVESAPRLGGKIWSIQENGFVIEGGADSFLPRKGAALELCRSLGLNGQLIGATDARTVYVWNGKRLVPMPEGLLLMGPTRVLPFLRSQLISWPGKLRIGLEMFLPRRHGENDESLASFVRRRLGSEALEKIAGPLLAGIYSADPEKLSLESTFPFLPEMERKYGSILRGMMARKPGPKAAPSSPAATKVPDSGFLTFRGGLQQMVDGLASQLPAEALLLGRSVVAVARRGGRYEVAIHGESPLLADEVVFATPAYVTADLMQQMNSALSAKLREIPYVSTATVSLGFRREDIPIPLDGSGFMVPRGEKRRITACSWSSIKFQCRAPEGFVLLRVFVGGAGASQIAEQSEEDLVQLALEEVRATMGVAAVPVLAKAFRWQRANPQYEIGHKARIEEIEKLAASHPGLRLAGAAYRGPGVPDCIQSGIAAAEEILMRNSSPDRSREDLALCGVEEESK